MPYRTIDNLGDNMPAKEPSKRAGGQKLSDYVYEQIFARIIDGNYRVNTKLPPEVDLAEEFQLSRPVVREALAKLRDDGVIVSRQGSGSVVTRRPDNAILRFAPIGSIADMQRCFEFRAEVEGAAARLAAARRDELALAEIAQALRALDECVEQGLLGVKEDLTYHMAICKASKNQFFIATLASIQTQISFGMNLTRNLSLTHPVSRLQLVQNEHKAIYEAIRQQEAQTAREAMVTHITNAKTRVFEGADEPSAVSLEQL
jgi:DNA-binding FadR family transcriptional regulator